MAFEFTCASGAVSISLDSSGNQYPVCTDGSGAWLQATSFAEAQVDAGQFGALMGEVFFSMTFAYIINKTVKTFFGGRNV